MTTLTNVTIENIDKSITWAETPLTWESTQTWGDFTEITSITAI